MDKEKLWTIFCVLYATKFQSLEQKLLSCEFFKSLIVLDICVCDHAIDTKRHSCDFPLQMDALCVLTTAQLGQLAQMPGQLRDPQNVKKILSHVKPDQLGDFFDIVSPAISVCDKSACILCTHLFTI